jgi:hypothetical protein
MLYHRYLPCFSADLHKYKRILWEVLVACSELCARCRTLVRGTRGWLDLRGWSEITPVEVEFIPSFSPYGGLTVYLPNANAADLGDSKGSKEFAKRDTEGSTMSHNDRKLNFHLEHLEIDVLAPPSAGGTGRTRTTGFTGSSDALQLAKRWIHHCIQSHEQCGDNSHRHSQLA